MILLFRGKLVLVKTTETEMNNFKKFIKRLSFGIGYALNRKKQMEVVSYGYHFIAQAGDSFCNNKDPDLVEVTVKLDRNAARKLYLNHCAHDE